MSTYFSVRSPSSKKYPSKSQPPAPSPSPAKRTWRPPMNGVSSGPRSSHWWTYSCCLSESRWVRFPACRTQTWGLFGGSASFRLFALLISRSGNFNQRNIIRRAPSRPSARFWWGLWPRIGPTTAPSPPSCGGLCQALSRSTIQKALLQVISKIHDQERSPTLSLVGERVSTLSSYLRGLSGSVRLQASGRSHSLKLPPIKNWNFRKKYR